MRITTTSRLLVSVVVVLCWGSACAKDSSPQVEGTAAMPGQLTITYRATGGRPPVDLDLRLEADGKAALFLGSSYSIPTQRVDRLGTFGGAAPTERVDALRAYLSEHALPESGGTYGQAAPDAPSRFLAVNLDGRAAEFRLSGPTNEADIEGFEALLQAFATALTDQPIAAVQASTELATAAGEVTSTIVLQSVGTAPLPVLLPLRAKVDFEARMTLPSGATMPMALTTVAATADSLRLGTAGGTPGESMELPPKASYRLACPPIPTPQSTLPVVATGSVTLTSAEGGSPRELTLVTAEQPLS